MQYKEWVEEVPQEITNDSLWHMKAYRLALFLGDICWHDATKIADDRRLVDLSSQLYRAVGSVSANLAEGYSRSSRRDRARFYEYALGSARESRDWYFKARHRLGTDVTRHRLRFLTEIIRLLLRMIPQQRGDVLREGKPQYQTPSSLLPADVESLLNNVPLSQ